MAYGVILRPTSSISEKIVRYARRVGSHATPRMMLGEGAPPHVTLLHVDCRRDAAVSWWRLVRADLPTTLPVTLVSLAFAPIPPANYYVPEGGIFCGLEAVRTPILEDAHRRTLKHALDSGLTVLGTVGDEFRPHVTLGILSEPPRTIELTPDVVTTTFDARPALGELGPYGTFPRILEEV